MLSITKQVSITALCAAELWLKSLRVMLGCERYGGDLTPVAPFCQKSEHKSLQEHRRAEPRKLTPPSTLSFFILFQLGLYLFKLLHSHGQLTDNAKTYLLSSFVAFLGELLNVRGQYPRTSLTFGLE